MLAKWKNVCTFAFESPSDEILPRPSQPKKLAIFLNGDCDIAIVVSADSDMIPAIELAKSAGVRVYVFFPPSHHSEAIAKIPGINVIRMQWYETRFKQSLLPDEIVLK